MTSDELSAIERAFTTLAEIEATYIVRRGRSPELPELQMVVNLYCAQYERPATAMEGRWSSPAVSGGLVPPMVNPVPGTIDHHFAPQIFDSEHCRHCNFPQELHP